jgi:acetyltransferase-like isoleucine patch superfamily enzyme
MDRMLRFSEERRFIEDLARAKAKFGSFGPDSQLGRDWELISAENVFIGQRVHIGRRATIQTITFHNDRQYSPRLTIGDDTSIENDFRVTCNHRVEIGCHVMIAGKVFMSDHNHEFEDPDLAVKHQPITTGSGLIIADDCHIGEGVSIFGSVEIGRHCIIGAGSIITKSIPEYSVVVGAPGRVIKRYDRTSGSWQRV